MNSEASDPADAIARALSRLRTSGRGPRHDHERHAHGAHGPHHHHVGAHGFAPPMRGGGPARMRMLDALAAASGPLSVSDLGAAIGVDQPRASRLVQQGVELGLVVREADLDDARRTRIALTAQGRQVAEGMRGQRRQSVSHALEGFTDGERAELARLLTKLADGWLR